MRWLCEQYYASAAFQLLAPTTRKVRRGILEDICRRAGNFRFATMEAQHVAKLRDEKAAYPEAANNRIKALRQLFAWATSPRVSVCHEEPGARRRKAAQQESRRNSGMVRGRCSAL
jgi:hypothetical protein